MQEKDLRGEVEMKGYIQIQKATVFLRNKKYIRTVSTERTTGYPTALIHGIEWYVTEREGSWYAEPVRNMDGNLKKGIMFTNR